MEQRDLLARSLDAGKDATAHAQDAIESLVRDLARNVEEQATQLQELVQELLDRGRSTSEQVRATIDRELRDQLSAIASTSQANVARLEDLTGLRLSRQPAPEATAKKATAKKTAAKKATAKKTAAKKTAAKKATAKKATARTATAAPSTDES